MDLLDIGGGFSQICDIDKNTNFNQVAPVISEAINKYFPEKHIRIIGEPGRYIV